MVEKFEVWFGSDEVKSNKFGEETYDDFIQLCAWEKDDRLAVFNTLAEATAFAEAEKKKIRPCKSFKSPGGWYLSLNYLTIWAAKYENGDDDEAFECGDGCQLFIQNEKTC